MTETARLALPLLAPGQAQKELFHNEALQALDVLVQGVCEGSPVNSPPAVPALGATYLVGDSPAADWSGHRHAVACWTEGGWRFRQAFEGLQVVVRSTGLTARYDGKQWQVGIVDGSAVRIDGKQVLSVRQPAIQDPSGGGVVDQEARATVRALLHTLREHGLIAAT